MAHRLAAFIMPNFTSKDANLGPRDKIILWIAQGFGSGRAPVAPGTFGTLPGIILYWAIADLPLTYYLVLTTLLFLIGIPLCGRAAEILDQTDPPSVVWDEIVGYLLTMIAIPSTIISMVVGFALFRLFDIWKPWPIGLIDREIKGGFGIMADDLVAGLFAWVLMWLLFML